MINDFYTVACMYSIQTHRKMPSPSQLASQLGPPVGMKNVQHCCFPLKFPCIPSSPLVFWLLALHTVYTMVFVNSTCIFVSCKICISVNIKILLCFNSYSLKAPTLVFLMNTGYPMDLHKLTHLYGVLDLTRNARQIVVEVNEIKKSSYIYNDNIFLLVHI